MILTGCHATGAESVYIRKFVTEEKHLPYIAIDTDYSTADQGQIATRLTAFLEMIQPGTDEDLDINYCYKIVLAGMTEQRSRAEILEEIWKYTHIPVCIKSGEQETEEWVGISREEAEQECGKRAERHSAAGRPYPAGGAGRTETATAAHKGTVIDGRKHFTPQHGGTAL